MTQRFACNVCRRTLPVDQLDSMIQYADEKVSICKWCAILLELEDKQRVQKYVKKIRKHPPYPMGVPSAIVNAFKVAKKIMKTAPPDKVRDILVDVLIESLHQLKKLRDKAPSKLAQGQAGATRESYSRTIAYIAQVLNAVLDSKVKVDELLRRLDELEKKLPKDEER